MTLANGTTTSFNMTLIARGLATKAARRTRAIAETTVSGSFSTGSGLTGSVQGSLVGTLENGTFEGSLAATSAAQAEERSYAGPVTSTGAAWVPGACIQSCTTDLLSGAVQTVLAPTTGTSAPVCSFGVAPNPSSFTPNGGSGSVAVTVTGNCPWSAEALASWITIVGNAAAAGSGSVSFTVSPNTGPKRQGSVRVAGLDVIIEQEGGSGTAAPQITVSPGLTGTPSTVFHINGTGFTPGGQVRMGPPPFQITVTAAANGTATDQTFTNPNVFQFDPGTYEFVATDLATARDSNRVVITVTAPPTITTQPASQTIASGSRVTLAVSATSSTPLSYQWYLGPSGTTTNPVGGATSSTYLTPTLTSTTNYWVRVTNAAGSANSNTAVVTVTAPPQSNLAFTFTPNPVSNPTFSTACSGLRGLTQSYWTWTYTLRIQNNSAVPFTIQSWTLNSPQGVNETYDAAWFQSRFGTQTIQANGSATASLCIYFTVNTSGSLTHSFTGTNGNGPFTTPSLSLLPPSSFEF
jgi:hypothetical protein